MPRMTLDMDDKFNQTLADLAQGSTKAEVIRRAIQSYKYFKSEVNGADGKRISIRDAAGNVLNDVVLP